MTTVSAHLDRGSGYAPLSECMSKALVLMGDNNYDMADGSLAMMLLMMANNVVMEVNSHPYRTGKTPIKFYTSPEDVREISDMIMIAGIAALYAAQQVSQKAGMLNAMYLKTMNQQLWFELNGNTKIQIRPVDTGPFNPTNGSDVEE
jgi:hypothetical protein